MPYDPLVRSLASGVVAALTILGLFLLSCGDDRSATPPGSTVEANTGAAFAAAERLFVLEEDGLFEHTEDQRIEVVARPDKSFIYDAAVSPEGADVALAIQGPPTQTPNGYSFGIDLFVKRGGGELMPVAVHERIGETMSRPVWLPGTPKLLFAVLGRDETGAADIRIELLDLDSGVRERYIEDALEPALSPDGGTLAYLHYTETGSEVITLGNLSTGETRPLLPPNQIMSNVANIAWSPDGTRIAFAASDPISTLAPGGAGGRAAAVAHPTLRDVWIVNLDGSGLHRITELADASLSLAWSADNRHIYAIGDTGFWSVDTADGALELIGQPNLAGRVQVLLLP